MEHISGAGNTEVPAYLALLQAGFRVERQKLGGDDELWVAEREDLRISGSSPLEILGLYGMRNQRGSDWKAEDAEIDAFLKKFYPGGKP
jgi:hypothetical protein